MEAIPMTPAESPLTPLTMTPEMERTDREDVALDGSLPVGVGERAFVEIDALRARLAAVTQERERLHGERVELIRRFGVASQRRFIPEERITDADVVEHAIVTSAVELQGLRAEVAALKAERDLTRNNVIRECIAAVSPVCYSAELALRALPLAAAVPDEGGPTT